MSQKSVAMGTADQFIAEFTALGAEAKRKNPEIKHACDHSIELSRPFGLNANVSHKSMAQSHAKSYEESIREHPEFMNPILMSCNSKNQKLIAHAVRILASTIQLNMLPLDESNVESSSETIDLVVESLLNASNSTADIQVKLLQLLPIFFQQYAFHINDDTLSKLLFICSNLQGANKTPVIVNTAQATFSQLLDIVFEKVERSLSLSNDIEGKKNLHEVLIDNKQTVRIDQFSYDVQRIVSDLCTLIEHHKPTFLRTNYMSEDYGFEVMESLIKNNSELFLTRVELAFLLRTRIAPLLLRFLSSSKDFTLMVKVSRLILLILEKEFSVLKIESEVTLTMLTHILSKESGAPTWKKTMVLEIFVATFRNADLLKSIFSAYDNNPTEERKSVIHELLTTCFLIVSEQKHVLNTGDLIQPPVVQSQVTADPQTKQTRSVQTLGLNSKDISGAVRFIDSIDKQEPPQITENYNLYLILQILIGLSDCIQSSNLNLMKSTDPTVYINDEYFETNTDAELKASFTCARDLISSTWTLQLEITDVFIHSTLDNDLFSSTLKLLENLCYCSGTLSLNEVKHSILDYLAKCTLKLHGTYGYKSRVMTIGESIVGTISSTFGAVSNMSSQGGDNGTSTVVKFYPRTLNSRQTLCFHTLIRLAVSLGPHLYDDWEIVLCAMQWVSYYVDGPTSYNKKDVPPISEYLSNRDLQIIGHSLGEFHKSIFNLDDPTFKDILMVGTALSARVMSHEPEKNMGLSPFNAKGKIQPSIFNRLFYLNKLTDICVINATKFLLRPNDNMERINEFYSEIVADRENSEEVRALASRSFNQILKTCAEQGFGDKDEKTHIQTERKLFLNMRSFVQKLLELPNSKELLVASDEFQTHLLTLETLKSIVEKFGTTIVEQWVTIMDILNFPFLIIGKFDSEMQKEKLIKDNITLILKSSFETLKVILDEMLQSIPKSQVRVIIDTLYNFVEQKFDLNISFNSVSYFWLISDYLKEKIECLDTNQAFEGGITSEKALLDIVMKDDVGERDYFRHLWVYLVLKLSRTTPDERIQVRNGAIITTFSMIESFLSENTLLETLYDVVLSPVILQMKASDPILSMSLQDQKDWMESFTNVVNGITKLLLRQIEMCSSSVKELTKLLTGTVRYFIFLANLDYNWTELDQQIFRSYYDILQAFSSCDSTLPNDLREILYEPWSKVKINYNFNNGSLYQSSLCSLVDCFPVSLFIFKPIMTPAKFEKMLLILNSCIRYPILVDSRSDDKKCTKLQKSILDNLSTVNFDEFNGQFAMYESLLIQQLILIVGLPFHTRDLIVKKLGNSGVKIPTFVAASYYGMLILKKHIVIITDKKYLSEKSIIKVTKALLEPTQLKREVYVSVVDDDDKISEETTADAKETCLWMISAEMLVAIVKIVLTPETGIATYASQDFMAEIIPLFLQAFDCCFISNNKDQLKDDFDFKNFEILKGWLINFFNTDYSSSSSQDVKRDNIEHIISTLWKSSFFYEHDSIMGSIVPKERVDSESMEQLLEVLTDDENWDIFSTIEPTSITRRLNISSACFNDLMELTNPKNYAHISAIALPYFMARCAYGLRKFDLDARKIGTKSMTRIQEIELKYIAHGLEYVMKEELDLQTEKNTSEVLRKLYPLSIRIISSLDNKGIENTMTRFCTNIYT